jgi:hypothetical protein
MEPAPNFHQPANQHGCLGMMETLQFEEQAPSVATAHSP